MPSTKKLIRSQQINIISKALAIWSEKNKKKTIPDLVLHTLRMMVDQSKFTTTALAVKKIDSMVKRHKAMEGAVKKFVKKMEEEDAKERRKKKKNV